MLSRLHFTVEGITRPPPCWKWGPRHSGPQSAVSARAAGRRESEQESIFVPVRLLVAGWARSVSGVSRRPSAAADSSGSGGERAPHEGQAAGFQGCRDRRRQAGAGAPLAAAPCSAGTAAVISVVHGHPVIVPARVGVLVRAQRRREAARPAARGAAGPVAAGASPRRLAGVGGGTGLRGPGFPPRQVSTELWICCHRLLMIVLTPLSENKFFTPHLVDSVRRVELSKKLARWLWPGPLGARRRAQPPSHPAVPCWGALLSPHPV